LDVVEQQKARRSRAEDGRRRLKAETAGATAR
jgi:hypothetical protein